MREGLFQHVLFCGLRCGWAAFAVFAILMSFLCLLFPRFLKTTLKILHKRQQTFCWPTNKIHAINKAAFFFPLTVCNVRHTNVQHARMAFSTQVSVSNYEILPRLASSLEACETSFSKCISVQAQPEYVRLCSAAHKKL